MDETVKLIIEIPKRDYEEIKGSGVFTFLSAEYYVKLILNGIPLPKGHGRIGDIDELQDIFNKACNEYNIDNLSFISDMDMNFDLAPTIIEADKED